MGQLPQRQAQEVEHFRRLAASAGASARAREGPQGWLLAGTEAKWRSRASCSLDGHRRHGVRMGARGLYDQRSSPQCRAAVLAAVTSIPPSFQRMLCPHLYIVSCLRQRRLSRSVHVTTACRLQQTEHCLQQNKQMHPDWRNGLESRPRKVFAVIGSDRRLLTG